MHDETPNPRATPASKFRQEIFKTRVNPNSSNSIPACIKPAQKSITCKIFDAIGTVIFDKFPERSPANSISAARAPAKITRNRGKEKKREKIRMSANLYMTASTKLEVKPFPSRTTHEYATREKGRCNVTPSAHKKNISSAMT